MRGAFLPFCLIFQLLSLLSFGQPGNYFLSHYTPSDENIDYLSFDIAQTERGVIYFANKTGIVEFDGRYWNIIESPGAIYTLAITNGNEVYVGGLAGFGKLALNEENIMTFQPISKGDSVRNIFKSVVLKDYIFFVNETRLYRFNTISQAVDLTIKAPPSKGYSGMYEMDGTLYLSSINGELLQLQENRLIVSTLPFPKNDELMFINKLKDSPQYLAGTLSGKILIYNNSDFKELVIADSTYVNDNILVSGKWVNKELIALGTLGGGVVFINAITGKTEEVISYYTGLPDNEVFALMVDRNQGVWVAHDYGFTRIAPYLPFRTYNHYPGLSGNLLSAFSDSNRVYVGTSVGLFKLNKEEVFSEETYFVTSMRKATREEVKEERKKGRKGLFGFLKKKKDEEPIKKKDEIKNGLKKVVVKKTRKILEALDYSYKKVEGIEGKVTHLMEVDKRLVAAGVAGAYEIKDLEAAEILGTPVRSLFYSPSLKQILISTYNDRVRTLRAAKNGWEETFLFDTLRAYVGNIFEDHIENIWLCGRADVIKVELVEGAVSAVSSVPFSTPVLDETMGFTLGANVFVAASGAFHQYDAIRHQFVKYDSLPGPRKYFTSLGTFWYNDGHRWRTVNQRLQANLKLEWLGLFPDIRSLTMADDGAGIWLITSSNELYKFTRSDLQQAAATYPLFLKEVRGPGSLLSPGKMFIVDERESALSFEFIQPEYTNALAIEYQYMIEGISQSWSEWSASNNVVNFPFLTPGKYTLRIKSRDLFGQTSELESVEFRVIPPYWKRTWFYALEFVFFASLVYISLRLSAANNKYRHISQLLSILTVIMLIQLMQNAAESLVTVQTTPVMDFFVQVFIALLVLPLEYKMRRFMVEASEGKYNLKAIKTGKE